MFILVVGLPLGRSPEGAGAPALVGNAEVPVQPDILVLILSLIESLRAAEVRVETACPRTAIAVAATVIGREGMGKK